MSVCKRIVFFTRDHAWVGDLFSLFAVLLLFATIWFAIEFQALIFTWVQANIILHLPLVILALMLDVFLMLMFLNIGSAQFTDQDFHCFHTFRGRRHGGASPFTAFQNWVHHMEHVGKKHR